MKQLWVNLAVDDLTRTKAFFTQLGFSFEPKYTDEKAACLIVNESTWVMLLAEPFFKGFLSKPMADARATTEVLMGVSVGSRDEVNAVVEKAVALGAKEDRAPYDHGFMYGRMFSDLDGHVWEVFWMENRVG